MSFLKFEIRRLAASLIFSPVDAYAIERGLSGPRPRPIGPLKYLLTAMTVGEDPAHPFRPLELNLVRNPSGFDMFFGNARPATDPDAPGAFEPYRPAAGPSRRVVLANGRYALRIVSLFYAPFFDEVDYPDPRLNPDPRAATPPKPSPDIPAISLRPGPLYPFGPGTTTLRGVVQDQAGRGVAGSLVSATGVNDAYRTDGGGQWVLVFSTPTPIPKKPVPIKVRVERPDGSVDVIPTAIQFGADNSLSLTALRGWVQARGVGVRGASVRAGGLAVTTGDDGGFTVVFPANATASTVDVTATLADGRSQTESGFPVSPGTTLIVPTFRFD